MIQGSVPSVEVRSALARVRQLADWPEVGTAPV
jgi:hypothetical protein